MCHTSIANPGRLIRRKLAMFQLMDWVKSHFVTERDLRATAWALGSRHRGEIGAGAKAEIRLPEKSSSQRAVLRAVIRDEARKSQAPDRRGGSSAASGE